eukprot:1139508-Pelagomonas_calceolata.AAC.3
MMGKWLKSPHDTNHWVFSLCVLCNDNLLLQGPQIIKNHPIWCTVGGQIWSFTREPKLENCPLQGTPVKAHAKTGNSGPQIAPSGTFPEVDNSNQNGHVIHMRLAQHRLLWTLKNDFSLFCKMSFGGLMCILPEGTTGLRCQTCSLSRPSHANQWLPQGPDPPYSNIEPFLLFACTIWIP